MGLIAYQAARYFDLHFAPSLMLANRWQINRRIFFNLYLEKSSSRLSVRQQLKVTTLNKRT